MARDGQVGQVGQVSAEVSAYISKLEMMLDAERAVVLALQAKIVVLERTIRDRS